MMLGTNASVDFIDYITLQISLLFIVGTLVTKLSLLLFKD